MTGERILFVDDEEQIRKLLSTYLVRQGYRVELATDGNEALQAVRVSPPDLLITDVGMPNMNGFELTRRLRADHRTARLPILMLSARKAADDILSGYAEGADEYVSKPIEMSILAAKIDVLLKRAVKAAPAEAARALGRVVLFVHGKGGTGTTTLAVNTAAALAETKAHRVAFLDLNLEFPTAHTFLDLRPAKALADLAGMDPKDVDGETLAKLQVVDASGVKLLMGSDAPQNAELVTVPLVQHGIDHLRAIADYVVVDTPATFSQQVLAALDSASVVVLVTAAHIASAKAAKDWLNILQKLDFPKERSVLVLNRTSQGGLETEQVARFFERRPEIVVPFTAVFDECADRGRPLVALRPDNVAAKVMRDLAEHLTVVAPAGS